MGSVWALHHLQQFFTLRVYEEPPVFGNDHLGLAQDDSQGVFRCLRVERRILQPARPKSFRSSIQIPQMITIPNPKQQNYGGFIGMYGAV